MHLRGTAMTMEAILPDGTIQAIANVGKFNFNWMTNYIFADEDAPVLPKGTVIHLKAWFDNTATHKGNPRSGSMGGLGATGPWMKWRTRGSTSPTSQKKTTKNGLRNISRRPVASRSSN